MFLLILEGLGTSELVLILIVALVIFGPRKLPQLSRSLGKSLADFRRASEDFKQTWQKEVDRESIFKDTLLGDGMLPEDRSILGESRDRTAAVLAASEETQPTESNLTSASLSQDEESDPGTETSATSNTPDAIATRKRDWL